MKFVVRSHAQAEQAFPKSQRTEIEVSLRGVKPPASTGGAPALRKAILGSLKESGWAMSVAVAAGSDITITAMKGEVGLCLQTGNMARMYADLIKLQTLYLDNVIRSAAILVPSEALARTLGSNVAQSRRLDRELDIFRKAYHVPTLVYSLEVS